MQNNSKYHVPNLDRALKIFELLSINSRGLSIADISNSLDYPRNSVFRIISTLFDSGYLIKDEELKTYYLSRKMLTLGIQAYTDPSIVEISLPEMHKLVSKYGETVPLGIIRDGNGIVLEEVAGTHSFRYVLEPGKQFNIHTSAAGKSIMAFLPPIDFSKNIEKINFKKFNKRTITSLEKFYSELKKVRKNGYAIDNAEEIEGMHCLGAPIFNGSGDPVAAIWITGPAERIRQENYEKIGLEVKLHADRISKNLGFDKLCA